jgi:hypothetical protein
LSTTGQTSSIALARKENFTFKSQLERFRNEAASLVRKRDFMGGIMKYELGKGGGAFDWLKG